jgi:hypothetical protein
MLITACPCALVIILSLSIYEVKYKGEISDVYKSPEFFFYYYL